MASDGCYFMSRGDSCASSAWNYVRVVKSSSKGRGTEASKERCDDSQAVDELSVLSCSVMVQG